MMLATALFILGALAFFIACMCRWRFIALRDLHYGHAALLFQGMSLGFSIASVFALTAAQP
jgi:hypothetical protein